MARADVKASGEHSNGTDVADATSLIFCSVSAVAQAVSRSLDLTRVCQLPIEQATNATLRPIGREPDLALVIDSNVRVLVAAVRAIKRRWKHIRVLVVGLHNAQAAILTCVEAGADGLFMADEPLERLPEAVRQLLSGKFRPPPNLLKIWADETGGAHQPHKAPHQRPTKIVELPADRRRVGAGRETKLSPWSGGLPTADHRAVTRKHYER